MKTKIVSIKLVYPKGLSVIKSTNRPNPNAKKNTHGFLNRTVVIANNPIEKGIVVIPLANTVSKVNIIIIIRGIYLVCMYTKTVDKLIKLTKLSIFAF